jgi:anaerobic sulfite reductase subunit B
VPAEPSVAVRADPGPGPGAAEPMVPVPYRVVAHRRESADVATISLLPASGAPPAFRAGQFNMLTAYGVGEAAVSVSSAPGVPGPLLHTVRDVGPVTHTLVRARPGGVVGVRGPFGTDWGVEDLVAVGGPTGDVVVVAGGIGLAPLRGALHQLVGAARRAGGRVFALVGARTPDQVVFAGDLDAWRAAGAHVAVTVDVGTPGWHGDVGLVTALLDGAGFDPPRTTALLCGPEVMMRFTARALVDLGVDPAGIRVSLERAMRCGIGWCGHCQLGPWLLCRDGPVLDYAGEVARQLDVRER